MKYLSNPCKNKIRIIAFQKGFFLMTLILLCSLIGYGQNAMTVQGIVTNKDSGLPIDGASVMIKGTTKGTITDDQGHYKITVNNDATLVFSYVGFETLEKPVTGLEQLNVSLVSVSGTMDVVVVAGAIMKKSDLTGAVATISADQIAATPTTDINQAIQGKLPGVYVKSSAQPGSGASIQIRGINSIQYGTSPIFVVDGTIIDGGITR
ncbi:hypothetical protein FSB73_07240 [Arachidicoccus ginsenosidivorans]|uniref:TonB-dependent receptor plug domain-containing protein n=1 Tax=Arachidicoccus ginsenosidivorans TaxID=496057 RepID=A0A5B8VKK9_9BACT|nr:carboxypeptidase-like regulatory domain-containing protein [Arachidicoccus ginsenosidivorans]QEC71495.1 hypothetical protein FSB73_07240 [Arachidicoccus ginsenosidivorans]